jgi:general L-amino acid transport system permease protein
MTELSRPGRRRPGLPLRLRQWWGPRPILQIAVLLGVVAIFYVFNANTQAALARQGMQLGFGFLGRTANFQIGEALIPFQAGDTYLRALTVGLLNTVNVAFFGCILATILGVAVGIAGLSGNALLAGVVRWYIEVLRNTPLLLQLFFWSAATNALPPPRGAYSAFDLAFLSNRGVFLPAVTLDAVSPVNAAMVAAALAVLIAYAIIRRRRGQSLWARSFFAATGLALAAIVAAPFVTGTEIGLDVPALAGFNIRGGLSLTPEFAALLVGLVVKFSAVIAEIVRAGIQSVDKGQWEAARAVGLRDGQIMRLVVLPQALRVIIPILTSSYLDLTKDSSLAVAIGYPEIVSITNTTANTTGQALEALAILVGVYLTLNLRSRR